MAENWSSVINIPLYIYETEKLKKGGETTKKNRRIQRSIFDGFPFSCLPPLANNTYLVLDCTRLHAQIVFPDRQKFTSANSWCFEEDN